MTQHMEATERSMHNRIQRLEAIRISLEEVRKSALGTFERCKERCKEKAARKALWHLPLLTFVKIVMCCKEEQKTAVYQLKLFLLL